MMKLKSLNTNCDHEPILPRIDMFLFTVWNETDGSKISSTQIFALIFLTRSIDLEFPKICYISEDIDFWTRFLEI